MDPATRGAARLAALVAVPVAVLAGVVSVRALSGTAAPRPSASPGPQATGPVTMPAPPLTDPAAVACRALVAQLPAQVRDRPRRPVTAGPEQNAAYGEPAITLACGGVPRPSVAPTDDVFAMSGVCWYAVTDPAGSTWYTLDREVPVAVRVPAAYDQPGQWANEFSALIAGSVKSITDTPTGCRD
jgi:Protein of unknown function (DUF3515)